MTTYTQPSPLIREIQDIALFMEPIIQTIMPDFWLGHHAFKVTLVHRDKGGVTTYRLKPCNTLRQFHFTPGQHACLAVEIDGRRLERTFSISSSLQALKREGYLELSIKTQDGGQVTPWLLENIKPGGKVHLKNIEGSFTFHPSNENQLFLAAGSGLTPILSILESTKARELNKLSLLYYVHEKRDAPFLKRLEILQRKGLSLSIIETGRSGRISKKQLDQYLNLSNIGKAYICGPAGFIASSQEILKETLSADNIHYEFFGLSSPTSKETSAHLLDVSNEAGKHTQITCSGATLLDELENKGLKPLFGCRAGICHQCTAQKLSGRVQNILTNEISENGPEQIQLCLCKAVSDTSLIIKEREA